MRRDRGTETDTDPGETGEWLEALAGIIRVDGPERAQFLLRRVGEAARDDGILAGTQPWSAYRNTISLEQQPPFPGDLAIERRLTSIMRWNALAMVVRANQATGELGGHVASYASAAEIFETGFNHFFRAASAGFGGDLVYFQPHSAPGVYARAFLEGRLTEAQLASYRREVGGRGLSSYPHPWLMPDFWQFPTGSMGIGPISSVYQARFLRYLAARGLADTDGRHVWGVFGDGEMDEPESIAGLTLAAREGLDNLTFIVNCNLQRLDGPVRGNGQIIQELESLFVGAGWNVIKVLWGSEWDGLFARDQTHALLRRFAATVDGQYQDLGSKDGDYNRHKFFDADPETRALAAAMTDAEINALTRGGHDIRKLHAAFAAARAHKGRPTVILAKTKKGFGMGAAGESRMTAHQAKKLDPAGLRAFRDRFDLPLSDGNLDRLDFLKPAADSPEMVYLRDRRAALGGSMPARRRVGPPVPPVPPRASFAVGGSTRPISTTMAAVRMLSGLLKDPDFGPRIVPIVADEARTFGMDTLFRKIGIYAPDGQLYEPEDAGSALFYREAANGQLLEEGITEAGALASWTAAATAYSLHGVATLPVFIYYSMFGFQRVGDLIWAAADQRARGFLIGATSGRTTLSGEGLQHQDGSSHLVAATIPNCRAWDPGFAAELAVILDHGARRMMTEGADEFHYITVMNEPYPQPDLPDGIEADLLRGLYRFGRRGDDGAAVRVRLVGSGAILPQVVAAADLLADRFGVASDIFSATSWSELAREARAVERRNRMSAVELPELSHVQRLLAGGQPVVAASDYVRALPQMIAPYLEARFVALGTDGFGRSDTRPALRAFFEVDAPSIALAAIEALVRTGDLPLATLRAAIPALGVDPGSADPWSI